MDKRAVCENMSSSCSWSNVRLWSMRVWMNVNKRAAWQNALLIATNQAAESTRDKPKRNEIAQGA
eukprot:7350151-Alexandrium_andersonii.AAC.1